MGQRQQQLDVPALAREGATHALPCTLTIHGAVWQLFGRRQRRICSQVRPAVEEEVAHLAALLLGHPQGAGEQVGSRYAQEQAAVGSHMRPRLCPALVDARRQDPMLLGWPGRDY